MATKTRARTQTKRAADRGRGPWLVGGAAALVVLVALVVASVTAGGDGEGDDPGIAAPDDSYGTVFIDGDALPRLPQDATIQSDPALGSQAPVVTALDLDGREVRIGEGGQLVAFLAHWCSHCQREVPLVVDWLAAGGLPDGVELVAVATSTDPGQPNFPPEAWLDREGWPASVVLDDEASTAGLSYGVSSYPFWAAIDSDGAIIARVSGVLEADQLSALAEAVAAS